MRQPSGPATDLDNSSMASPGGNRFVRDAPALPPGAPRSQSTSPFRLTMPDITPGQLAFSAMQFLPVPVLVLDGWKTVVLANAAMGRLLGMAPDGEQEMDGMVSVMDQLRGQSLSQVGIDLVQDKVPVWVDWEQFLEQVATEISHETGMDSRSGSEHADGDATPVPTVADGYIHQSDKTTRRGSSPNAVVEVVISRRDITRTTFDTRARSKTADFHAHAKMIVSVWNISESQTFFTLTFTNTDLAQTSLPAGRELVVRSHLVDAADRKCAITLSNPPSQASSHGSASSSFMISPSAVSLSSSPFPPLGPPSKSSVSSTPSVLQKITLMKDTLLDSTQTPILAMWKDGSVTLPNRAARNLFSKSPESDKVLDGFELLPSWALWTEDFSRQLDPSEYPISVLNRTETPFTGRRIGMRDSDGRNAVYEAEGTALRDSQTGEFLAGVVTCRDVTCMTEEISRIKAADEERFKLICDTMPQLVWTATPDGAHDFFNSRWYNYTGLSEEDSLGLGWKNPFHPDDIPEARKRWRQSLLTGEPYMTEYRCRSKDGNYKWFLGRALPLRNKQTGQIEKWFGTCTDVHESIESKLEAKRIRQQLLSVIALSHMTMFTIDVNYKVTMLEGALIWGSNCENNGSSWYIGENVYDVFNRLNSQLPEGQMPPFLIPLDCILSGRATEDFQEHEMEGRWYRTRFRPVTAKNSRVKDTNDTVIEGVIGLIMDVTELKAREKDIQDQVLEKRQLVANEAAAKEASRLKSQFLANMSHEIRTPITGVIGMAELLLDAQLGEEQLEITENIYRSGNALLTVINDILDLSKVESGRLDIEEVQFSLSVIVRDVGKMLSFAAERKDLDFQADIASDIESNLVVIGDPGRVRQIITNLLTNSIKFTNQGCVKFSVLKEKETPDIIEIRFVVEDTGIGIEEEVRKRLFQPFSQGDPSTARRFGGTGLGLTICKNLLDLMKGRMTMESTIGTGTTATFWVPFNKPHGSQSAGLVRIGPLPDRLQSEMSVSCNSSEYEQMLGPAEQGARLPEKGRSSWRHLSISSSATGTQEEDLSASERANIQVLVVEDNAINQQIAIKTIRKLGFQVTAVWNGKEALEYLVAAEEGIQAKPNIILMDVQMPVIDGYKCTHLLRHHLPYKAFVSAVPIVAMTASAIQGDKEKCKRAGMDDYLAKPVKNKTLERMLVRWSRRKRADTPPISGPSSISDCAETGESCDNTEIPGVGHEDALTPVMTGDYNGLDDKHSVDTPRPLALNDATDHYPFPGNYAMPPPPPTPPPSTMSPSESKPTSDCQVEADLLQPIRRIVTDERAMNSRDDKLIDVASCGGASTHSMTSPLLSTGEALTVENIGRLEKESSRISSSKYP
ncbi:hsp90-like protein [Lasiosphaeria miniovina]|uniref:histidine kinase n=1 Tax=Lasiosphaeria miniovina TaxID=1954250 RepID=A0AA40BHS7_9PEZI|nr:hsp90-like protein [Lasiosphaeria miniovina]KAK0734425.1 hsp90-like protein [Lasiosphaeria miniovina]